MQIKYNPITVIGDEAVLAKVAELEVQASGAEIEGLRVDADTLVKLFNIAERKADNKAALANYLAMKDSFIKVMSEIG